MMAIIAQLPMIIEISRLNDKRQFLLEDRFLLNVICDDEMYDDNFSDGEFPGNFFVMTVPLIFQNKPGPAHVGAISKAQK